MDVFTLIFCKNCIVCVKRPKIYKNEAGGGPFIKICPHSNYFRASNYASKSFHKINSICDRCQSIDSLKAAKSKPVKQEVSRTVILPLTK